MRIMKSIEWRTKQWLLVQIILVFISIDASTLAQSSTWLAKLHSHCSNFPTVPDGHLQNWLTGNYSRLLNQLNESETSFEYSFYRDEIAEKLRRFNVNLIREHSRDEAVRQVIGDKKCEMSPCLREQTFGNICPHHFNLIDRLDRYPFRIMRAIRNCPKNKDMIDSTFNLTIRGECHSVQVLKPVMHINTISCRWEFAMEHHDIAFNYRIPILLGKLY